MGMFDKIKNLFYEDELIEVPKEKLADEVKIQGETTVEVEKKDELDEIVSERDLLKSETSFKFPIIFEDEDFVDMEKEKPKKQEPIKSRENKNTLKYKKPTLDREVIREVIEKPKKFSPSPVISPVYGVLDKDTNKKGDFKNKSNQLEHTKEMVINFDTIRQKAYGSLSDDIEKELSPMSSDIDDIEQEIDNILDNNNLLDDLKEDTVTIEKEDVEVEEDNTDEYNYADFGVEYKIDNSLPEEKNEVLEEKENNNEDEQGNEESSNNKDVELTADLFNLIDSMYDR